jgi:mono/diheme cytochrome c family protein
MLRQTRAKWLALATAALVVLVAAAFAALHNTGAPSRPEQAPAASVTSEAGRAAFERLGCAMCHSIAGTGNPGSPLDAVGGRLDRAELRAWSTGTGAARDRLRESIVRVKARAADDPELDALLDYLASLK